jgi:hypothetical protein
MVPIEDDASECGHRNDEDPTEVDELLVRRTKRDSASGKTRDRDCRGIGESEWEAAPERGPIDRRLFVRQRSPRVTVHIPKVLRRAC